MKMRRLVSLFFVMTTAAAPLAAQHRMQLGSDSATWAAWSGQLRLRGENWRGFGAGAPAGADHDDAFALSRLLLRGEIQVAGHVSLLAELKSSLAVSRDLPGGRRPADEDVFDVQQLFAEARATPFGVTSSARAGRFELAFGRERLVSPLDWGNTRRTFQGAAARVHLAGFTWQPFWVEPVNVRRRQPNTVDSTRQLYGVYASHSRRRHAVDAWWLRHEARLASFNGTTGPDRRHTIGARAQHRPQPGSFDLDLEAAGQIGSIGGNEVRAFMIGSQGGDSFRGARAARIYVGLDAGSGDPSAGGDVGTFHQLYPLGHAYLGYLDVHGRQNVVDLSAGLSLQPLSGMLAQLDVHDFRRASRGDGLYATDGSLSRAPGAATARRVGTEVDVTVRRSFSRNRLVVQAGASRYFAGGFLRQTGPARDINWFYGQAALSF
jgi:hypothetical protein